ncbi:MAG: hypothetical protein HKN27_15420 [Silicimonas sp.]|nr:hypothetical protein [Silicimonas sp.]
MDEILVALPDCRLTVLTPQAASVRSPKTLEVLFGDAAKTLPDPYALLRAMITETGHVVLDRVLAEGTPKSETLEELHASFSPQPDTSEVESRLGMDKLTQTLLNQRFEEDLEVIQNMSGIEVI